MRNHHIVTRLIVAIMLSLLIAVPTLANETTTERTSDQMHNTPFALTQQTETALPDVEWSLLDRLQAQIMQPERGPLAFLEQRLTESAMSLEADTLRDRLQTLFSNLLTLFRQLEVAPTTIAFNQN